MLFLAVANTSCGSGSEVNLDFANLGWVEVSFLGIVQGITELLPISSTAHLRIVPTLLGMQDPGSAFSAAMQLASLTAVLVYFWQDLKKLTGETFRAITGQDYQSSSLRLMLGLLLGTLPIIVTGALLKPILNACNSPMRGLIVISAASIIMSGLLAIAEKCRRGTRTFDKLTLRDGILVGIAQAFALIPGVSRSGSTLTAGMFLGMERETSARFSFLLGLPAVILAGAVELHTLFKAGLSASGWLTLLVGLICASISAFLAIWGLLHYLEKHSTWIFVFYRFAMGIFLIVAVMLGWLQN
ncbi:undecaprenyl-diphosphate phosphatase [Nostoc sp. NMS8]|uniref:undecaprenyl-diphosphate phosphatase n=1 Tax=Nostoc sp. NMS8 TaxID=2815392 RepID=UPI0025F97C88|nr:undecaprenyl-diphosphate phosphatase [Nostoc sp. NMS8]MBN3963445.1 undecaprenyl-diphosphate phosphatase [Nostoc sp. NMS8]